MTESVELDTGNYTLSFAAYQQALSATQTKAQIVNVLVDGKQVGSFTPTTTGYNYYQTSSFAIATTGLHTIEFLGTSPTTANSTVYIDRVSMTALGAQSIRLRVGDAYQNIATSALLPAAGQAGTSASSAYTVPTFVSNNQSYVVNNQIETTAYDLQWPDGTATAITGVDATTVPTLSALNTQTFQLTDDKGKTVTFEFIDTNGTSSLTAGNIEIAFNSKTDTIANIPQYMANVINAAGLDLTAAVQSSSGQSDGVTLAGGKTGPTFNSGSTKFLLTATQVDSGTNVITANDPGASSEGSYMTGVGGSVANIPTYYYNFPSVYGTNLAGNPATNNITPEQEQDTEEIFQLYSKVLGVQFIESSSTQLLTGKNEFGIATGDIFPIGALPGNADVGVAGLTDAVTATGAIGQMAVMDGAFNWGTSAFGGAWMQVAMHEIMRVIQFDNSINFDNDASLGDTIQTGTADLILPGIGDLTTGLNLFQPNGGDLNMYKVTLTTPGTLSAETIAQRQGGLLADPSQLNTELRVFQENSDGTYSAIAQNDDYFGTDSYLSMSLPVGTYYIGVSSTGNNAYDPSEPDTGSGGTTTGPYQLRVNFAPQENIGPAQATSSLAAANGIVLTGSSISVNKGTTPFTVSTSSGLTKLTGFDTVTVPNIATLNGETFTITNSGASYTFQFVDTSNAANAAQVGDIAIDYNSSTDTINSIQGYAVTAINDVFTELVGANGTPFDGTGNGNPGGEYNFWFNVAGTETSGIKDRTIFVDKSAASGGTGGLTTPYTTITAALTAATSDALLGKHDIIRVEGNNTSSLTNAVRRMKSAPTRSAKHCPTAHNWSFPKTRP